MMEGARLEDMVAETGRDQEEERELEEGRGESAREKYQRHAKT